MRTDVDHRSSVIAILRWPEESDRRSTWPQPGTPRLLLVSLSAPPPVWAVDEDWLLIDEPLEDRAHREATFHGGWISLPARPHPPSLPSSWMATDWPAAMLAGWP